MRANPLVRLGERVRGVGRGHRDAPIYVARPARWRLGAGSSAADHGSFVRGWRSRFVSVSVRTTATSAFGPEETQTRFTLGNFGNTVASG